MRMCPRTRVNLADFVLAPHCWNHIGQYEINDVKIRRLTCPCLNIYMILLKQVEKRGREFVPL